MTEGSGSFELRAFDLNPAAVYSPIGPVAFRVPRSKFWVVKPQLQNAQFKPIQKGIFESPSLAIAT
jgi:hypothetical protein